MKINRAPFSRVQKSGLPRPALRLLVADDSEAILAFHTLLLSQAGYQVDAAADGGQAWMALSANEYDLLVTDNDMPVLTGLELVKRLRRSGRQVQVIIVSGSVLPSAIEEVADLDLAAVLMKPVNADELVTAVRKVLQPKRSAPPSIEPPGAPGNGRGFEASRVVFEDFRAPGLGKRGK